MGLDQAATVFNYFVGDQANWREAVPTYHTVAYPGLYDGIDLHIAGQRVEIAGQFRLVDADTYTFDVTTRNQDIV